MARLVIGGGTAARRVHQRLGAWLVRWRRRFGPKNDAPLEVPWSQVMKIGIDVQVDVDAKRTTVWSWESWVHDHIISRIPGA